MANLSVVQDLWRHALNGMSAANPRNRIARNSLLWGNGAGVRSCRAAYTGSSPSEVEKGNGKEPTEDSICGYSGTIPTDILDVGVWDGRSSEPEERASG